MKENQSIGKLLANIAMNQIFEKKIFIPKKLDSNSIFHWEVEFGQPIIGPGFIANLWIDKLNEKWIIYAQNAENGNSVSLVKRLLSLLKVLLGIIIYGLIGVLLPFVIVWASGAFFFNHSEIFVTITLILGFHFGIGSVYIYIGKYLHREPKSRELYDKVYRVVGFLSLILLMYSIAAPNTTRFISQEELALDSILTWLYYYGYMFVNIIFLGAPQSIIDDVINIYPNTVGAAIMVFLLTILMAVSIYFRLKEYSAAAITRKKTVIGTLAELKEYLKENKKKYRKVSAKFLELETSFGTLTTEITNLNFDENWSVYDNGVIYNEKDIPENHTVVNLGKEFSDLAAKNKKASKWKILKVGFNPLIFFGVVFSVSLLNLIILNFTTTIDLIGKHLILVVLNAIWYAYIIMEVRGKRKLNL